MFHFTKCLIENRHSGENSRVAARKVGENRSRSPVATDDQWNTARNQRRKKITEPIGVGDRDDAEIQIGLGNFHRVANLIAIGQKLFAAKAISARCSGSAGGKPQESWRILAPIRCSAGCLQPNDIWCAFAGGSGHYSRCLANLESLAALLFADRLFERKNGQMPAQTTEQNRRPIFMVADLHAENVAFTKDVHPLQEITCALFDLAERPEPLAASCKDSDCIASSCECFLPPFQQWI